jgi:Tfp pilus assembly protein PilF
MAEAERYEEALALAEKYLKDNPLSPQVFFLMARIFMEMAELRQAARMLKKALYLDPNLLEAIKLLAVVYGQQGDEANFRAFESRHQRVEMRLRAGKLR